MNQRKSIRKEQLQKEEARRAYIKKLRPLIYAFIAWFVVLAILHIPAIKDHLRYIMVSFTHISAITAGKLLFLPVTNEGYPIMGYDGFTMRVILECTAYNFYLFALMITLFAPWSIKAKLVNLGAFVLVIFTLNNLRFLIMGAVGKHHPHLFEHIHDYFWNILFGLMIFLIYLWADHRAGGIFATAHNSTPEEKNEN